MSGEQVTEQQISRRRFLGATAAAGAGVLAGHAPEADARKKRHKRRMRRRKADVIVIGEASPALSRRTT
jgi:TAT (twin-arginine translocation) pathway signal sequence